MSEKKKSAPLQSKQAVIKSAAKLPALKHKGEWVEFDAYVEAARRLDQLSDAVLNHEQGNPTWGLPSADGLQASYDEFERYWKMFERDELYRKRNKERWVKRPKDDNHPGGGYYTKTEITRRVVLEKIGLLVGSFPNATPHNMETYVGMLAEEIIAANPRVSVLEATFRELRRSKTFLPTIAEVLKEIYQQDAFWHPILEIGQDYVDDWIKLLAKSEEAYQARLAKEAEEKRLAEQRQREQRERCEREKAEREQREREKAERKQREEAEFWIACRVRSMARLAESRFLWRYFYLLMLSHGIFLSFEQLRQLRLQHEREEFERNYAKLDPSEKRAWAQTGLAIIERTVARGIPLDPNLAALKREYEEQINQTNAETHKLNGGGEPQSSAQI